MCDKSSSNKEKKVSVFLIGQIYKTINYNTGKSCELSIIDRNGKWLKIDVEGKRKEVRANPVMIPISESIILDDYSPVFSYQCYKQDMEED